MARYDELTNLHLGMSRGCWGCSNLGGPFRGDVRTRVIVEILMRYWNDDEQVSRATSPTSLSPLGAGRDMRERPRTSLRDVEGPATGER